MAGLIIGATVPIILTSRASSSDEKICVNFVSTTCHESKRKWISEGIIWGK